MLGLSMCMGSHPIAHSISHFTSCNKYTFGKCRQRCPFLINITHTLTLFRFIHLSNVVEVRA